jgi:type III restriction enzyme
MQLKEFQLRAISSLLEAMSDKRTDIVLKSCTGSGKTIIITNFMEEYSITHPETVFIWLTPGKGNLEEQSKAKMDVYIKGSQTKDLADVMNQGFQAGDKCFINWEKLTKKGNNALKDGDNRNFKELIIDAKNRGLSFSVIVDESHQNDTIKAKDIIEYFEANKIIRCSATPAGYANAKVIEIDEFDVIAAGLIKKMLVINENFEQNILVDNQIDYLLSKALQKQRELRSAFLNINKKINPLIVVQLPNKNEVLLDHVETWFENQGIDYVNKELAVWLDKKKENIDDITDNDNKAIAVIIKQAIATGWDCPRAHILVKLRDNMNETFEIQTIGRVRRMPEALHYDTTLLDSCYLYTLDEKFTESVKQAMGKDALDATVLTLKQEFRSIELISEQAKGILGDRDATDCLRAIYKYFKKEFNIDGKTLENRKKLDAHGFILNNDIVGFSKNGGISELTSKSFSSLNDSSIVSKLSTHTHGREYHHRVGEIGLKIAIEYEKMNVIIRRLFDKTVKTDTYRIVGLETKQVYAFVINNFDRLKNTFHNATAYIPSMDLYRAEILQLSAKITKTKYKFPIESLFTYDGKAKTQTIFDKNVYSGYRSSAEPRSGPEIAFEKACEKLPAVEWWYKNGDKGSDFLSIAYEDSMHKVKLFYPDYILCVKERIWIIETKGGFDKYGNSQDIDVYTPMKFEVLQRYLSQYDLCGGIVKEDGRHDIFICTENYVNDISNDCWKPLEEILK